MAKEIEIEVVAKGVENIEQAIWLKNNNYQLVQVYFFEKPKCESDFLYLISQDSTYTLEQSDILHNNFKTINKLQNLCNNYFT